MRARRVRQSPDSFGTNRSFCGVQKRVFLKRALLSLFGISACESLGGSHCRINHLPLKNRPPERRISSACRCSFWRTRAHRVRHTYLLLIMTRWVSRNSIAEYRVLSACSKCLLSIHAAVNEESPTNTSHNGAKLVRQTKQHT